MQKQKQKKIQHKQNICRKQLEDLSLLPSNYNPKEKQTLIIFHNGKSDKDDLDLLKEISKDKVYFIPGRNFCFIQDPSLFSLFISSNDQNLQGVLLKNDRNLFAFLVPYCSFEQMYNIPNLYSVPNAVHTSDIPGLHLIQDFLDPKEETYLINQADQGEWIVMARRRVKHFGYDFIYGQNTVYLNNPSEQNIPEYVRTILPRIYQEIKNIFPEAQTQLDQLTINDYEPGEGIPPHIDVHTPFKDIFVSLSLSSGCVMTFQNAYDLTQQTHLFFPQRSLMIFSGEARYGWYHSIATRKMDLVQGEGFARDRRISITLRQIQNSGCQCAYKEFCDSQMYNAAKMNIHNNNLVQK